MIKVLMYNLVFGYKINGNQDIKNIFGAVNLAKII